MLSSCRRNVTVHSCSERKRQIGSLLRRFPKIRPELDEEYRKIYVKHYMENRSGGTKVSRVTAILESWGHRKVAGTARNGCSTLEIGAGTLNQFGFEKKTGIYDIVEPFSQLYENSEYLGNVDRIYADISEVEETRKYDRITSVYAFEHILNLPEVIARAALKLNEGGILAVAIPNEGRFMWKAAYTCSSGLEFRRRYGLDYEVIMRHEHVNTADEIETLLAFFFRKMKRCMFGIGKDMSLYRYYECSEPRTERCRKYLE